MAYYSISYLFPTVSKVTSWQRCAVAYLERNSAARQACSAPKFFVIWQMLMTISPTHYRGQ